MVFLGNKCYDWCYEFEFEFFMNGCCIFYGWGKVLGGSSSINGMIFICGNLLDYIKWLWDLGLEDWSYVYCLFYFKWVEDCLVGGDVYYGIDGLLKLECGFCINFLFGVFFDVVQEVGYLFIDDVNGFVQEGFGFFDCNIYWGW